MRRSALVLLPVLAALLPPAGPAQAHADLVTSRPVTGAQLADDPTHVVLEFAQPVSVGDAAVQVTDASGTSRAGAPLLSQAGRSVSVVLDPPVGGAATSGGWDVRYRVRGSDGHVISGRLVFAVDDRAARAGAPLGVVPAVAGAAGGLAAAVLVLRLWVRRSEEASA